MSLSLVPAQGCLIVAGGPRWRSRALGLGVGGGRAAVSSESPGRGAGDWKPFVFVYLS